MEGSIAEHAGALPVHLHDVTYVQELLGCSAAKVFQLAARGELGSYKTGHRSIRFSDQHIADFLARHERPVVA